MIQERGPIVSIIIPAYNAARWIHRSIESVLHQDYPHIEIIVVDDGSEDNTSSVVKSYNGKVRYVHQENKGPGAARNTGANESSGEYLMFLDADDEYLPGIVKKMVEGFVVYPDADAGMFGYIRKSGSDKFPHPVQFTEDQITWVKDFFEIKLNYSIPCTDSFICRKDIFLEVGGYTTAINCGEDKKLFICLGGKYNWFFIPEYGAVYHSSKTATTTQNTPIDPYLRIRSLILSEEEIREWIRPDLRKNYNKYHQFIVKYTIGLSQSYIDNYYKFYKALKKRTKISLNNMFYCLAVWVRSTFRNNRKSCQ